MHKLSTREQFNSLVEALNALTDMIRRLDRLGPLIDARRAVVLFDPNLELGKLFSELQFPALVSRLPRDLRQRWYLYTRNRAIRVSDNLVEVAVSNLPGKEHRVAEEVAVEMLSDDAHWLSFSGTGIFDADKIEAAAADKTYAIANSNSLELMISSWPRYEGSPKHRLDEYRKGGRVVSAMDLGDEMAEVALLISLESGGSRFARSGGKYYRFVLTNSGSTPPVFHGFQVSIDDVPGDIRHLL